MLILFSLFPRIAKPYRVDRRIAKVFQLQKKKKINILVCGVYPGKDALRNCVILSGVYVVLLNFLKR